MDKLEKVELIREKCEVSYADATAALDHANGDVLDAIIWLEEQGKTKRTTAQASTAPSSHENSMSKEMAQAQAAYRKSTESMWSSLTKLLKKSLKYKFIATRHGEVLLRIPVLLPIVGVFCGVPPFGCLSLAYSSIYAIALKVSIASLSR